MDKMLTYFDKFLLSNYDFVWSRASNTGEVNYIYLNHVVRNANVTSLMDEWACTSLLNIMVLRPPLGCFVLFY